MRHRRLIISMNQNQYSDALTVAVMMEAYARDAVEYARAKLHKQLDYSGDSIQTLEAILEQYHAARAREVRREKPSASPTTMDMICTLFGAYLGEAIRRNCGGEWELEPGTTPGHQTMSLRKGYAQTCPISKVLQRIMNGREDSVWFYFQFIAENWKEDGSPL